MILCAEAKNTTSTYQTFSHSDLLKMSDVQLIAIIQEVNALIDQKTAVSRRVRKTSDDAQSIMLSRYQPVVHKKMEQYRTLVRTSYCQYSDVAQTVQMAIIEAIGGFDTKAENSFMTYASFVLTHHLHKMKQTYNSENFDTTCFETTDKNKEAIKTAKQLRKNKATIEDVMDTLVREYEMTQYKAHAICSRVFFNEMKQSYTISGLGEEWTPECEAVAGYEEYAEFYKTPDQKLSEAQMNEVFYETVSTVLSKQPEIVREHFMRRIEATPSERLSFPQLAQVFASHGIHGTNGEPFSDEWIRRMFKQIQGDIRIELANTRKIRKLSDLV